MTNFIEFERPDHVDYVHQLAGNLKAKLTGNFFTIPQSIGSGFMWAEKLPCGITVMAVHTVLKEEITFTQLPTNEQYFCLQFNEYSKDPAAKSGTSKYKPPQTLQSAVRLTHTLLPGSFVIPAATELQSVCFFFNKEQLNNLLGGEAVNELLTNYFPALISSQNLEPIATDYRVTLNELLAEKLDMPLRLNFIQNRILLLLEKYIINLYGRKDLQPGKLKRTDDETLRLMQVEALLVRNFSEPAPTIDELSRISAMSPTKLKNDFKKLYRHPIYEYYQKNRMSKAKSLLLTGKYSIKEVGVMVGYSNLSHFATSFKKQFKMLPSEVMSKDGVLVYNS